MRPFNLCMDDKYPEAILDTEFLCNIVEATAIGDVPAVVTDVQGRA